MFTWVGQSVKYIFGLKFGKITQINTKNTTKCDTNKKNPKFFNFTDPKLFESAEISEVVRVTNKQLCQGWPYFNSSHYF